MAIGPFVLDLWTNEKPPEHICTLEKGVYLPELATKLARQHSRGNGPNTIVTLANAHTGDLVGCWRNGRPQTIETD